MLPITAKKAMNMMAPMSQSSFFFIGVSFFSFRVKIIDARFLLFQRKIPELRLRPQKECGHSDLCLAHVSPYTSEHILEEHLCIPDPHRRQRSLAIQSYHDVGHSTEWLPERLVSCRSN